MKKILHILPVDHGGGAAVNCRRFCENMPEIDHSVLVGGCGGSESISGLSSTSNYVECPSYWSMLKRLVSFKRKDSFDIFFSNGFGCLILSFVSSFFENGSPVNIHNTRGVNFFGNAGLIKYFCYFIIFNIWRSLNIVFVSQSELDFFVKNMAFFRPNSRRVFVIPNGLDFESMPKPDAQFRFEKSEIRALVVSRVCAQKDILGLIDSIYKLRTVNRKVFDLLSIDVFGELSDERYCEKVRCKIERLGLSEKVSLKGEKQMTRDLYRSYDLLIHHARFEGLATVLTESARAGLFFISRRVVGTRDFVTKVNEPCFFSDKSEFIRALGFYCDILEDRRFFEEIVLTNYVFVRDKFSVKNSVCRYRDLIDGQ